MARTKKKPKNRERDDISDDTLKLVDAFGDTSYLCGEWNRDDSDESYEKVADRADVAFAALVDRIVTLEKNQRSE